MLEIDLYPGSWMLVRISSAWKARATRSSSLHQALYLCRLYTCIRSSVYSYICNHFPLHTHETHRFNRRRNYFCFIMLSLFLSDSWHVHFIAKPKRFSLLFEEAKFYLKKEAKMKKDKHLLPSFLIFIWIKPKVEVKILISIELSWMFSQT